MEFELSRTQPKKSKMPAGSMQSDASDREGTEGAESGQFSTPFIEVDIPDRLFFRIGDVADLVGVKPYVLRYWETEFPIISPEKSTTGQRVYRRADVETLLLIKHLLYKERYSIEGARRRIKELRKDGELKTFKREKILGGEQKLAQSERLKELQKTASEIAFLAKKPLHEIFKY